MAGKPNICSIRFSDDLAELIDRQVGDTFTEKFENLITRCVLELPRKEEQLKQIQKQINEEYERLHRLQKAADRLIQTLFQPADRWSSMRSRVLTAVRSRRPKGPAAAASSGLSPDCKAR